MMDDLVQKQGFGRIRGLANSRDRTPLVKGPPGAFYQGVRSRPESKRASWAPESERPAKIPARHSSTRDYPTNTLRPLSLLASRRPSTPIGPAGRNPTESVRLNDFVYRSPLAPPERESWQELYSKSQLEGIRDAAKADGIFESKFPPNDSLQRESLNNGGSRKHLFETPRLNGWPRESSTRTDLAQHRKKVSIFVLCLCNLFPPMLFLYAIGRMDGIIMWWTRGEFSTFGKGQKRWAYILMSCWGLLTLFGLVAFLVYMLV
jgi:hypothetical protein